MQRLQLLALLTVALLTMSASCGKDDDKQDDPKPAELTLPLTVDFSSVNAAGKTSFTANGIDFTGAGLTSSSFTNGVPNCVASTNATIRQYSSSTVGTNSIQLAYSDFNCLIADVSRLPAIQKISVRMFDNGRPATQISLCDGTQVIGSSKTYSGANPTVTYTLNVGGKKASRFYITSSEANVYSITFE